MDRRAFLRLGTGALGSLALPGLLAACSRKQESEGLPKSVQALVDARVKSGAATGLDVFQGGSTDVAGLPDYVAFAMGMRGVPSWGHDATVWLVPDSGTAGKQVGPLTARYQPYARAPAPPGPQGVNAVTVTFDKPGVWYLVAETSIEGKRRVGTAAYQVGSKETSTVPYPGQPALPSETPTVSDHRGVNPICTREPPCDMHQVTLAAALKSGKPVVFAVGTPKFCMSRVCGPNLEEVLAVKAETGDRALFVHSDVYVNDSLETVSRQGVTETFRQWGFTTEPWLFVMDRSGTIAHRFEGALTAGQITSALTPLL